MLEHIIGEVAMHGIGHAAYEIAKELRLELQNARRFCRGELDWQELSHAQKTLFLGGNREEYERIRHEIQTHAERQRPSMGRSSRVTYSGNERRGVCAGQDYGDLPEPLCDYGEL